MALAKDKRVILLLIAVLVGGCAGPVHQAGSAHPEPGSLVEDRLDLTNYIGERLHLSATCPSHISRLRLKLLFPEGHKLLLEAHPNVAIYNSDGELVWSHDIDQEQEDFEVNKSVSSPVFYAKIGVYYCKEGDQGLCLIQNILYEIDASRQLPAGPLELEYELPGSYF